MTSKTGAALALALGLAALPVLAQTASPPAPQAGERQAAGPRFPSCDERFAREAGRRAYLGARLNLTAEQRPLWQSYVAASEAAAEKHRQACLALATGRGDASAPERPNAVARLDMRERRLAAELERIAAVKPAFQNLYQALTAEQRQILERPERGMRGRHGHPGRFQRHQGPRGEAAPGQPAPLR